MNAAIVVLAILGAPIVAALSAMWSGYVLTILWAWFIVPTFGLPAISVPIAVGITLLAGMLTNHRTGNEPEGEGTGLDRFVTSCFTSMLTPALTLLVAWIAKSFI